MGTRNDSDDWLKTIDLRVHRLITSYNWSTHWYPVYTQTIQQKFVHKVTHEVKWQDIEIAEEEVPNCPRYG
jgi:hypothetical protein